MSLVDGTTPTIAAADAAILAQDPGAAAATDGGTDSLVVTDGNEGGGAALSYSDATYYGLLQSNTVALQIQGEDGVAHWFRGVVHDEQGDTVYVYLNGAPGLVTVPKSKIVGLSVIA